MKYIYCILVLAFFTGLFSSPIAAQCAVCAKTALQMGEKPAQGLNQGILYLMLMPFAIVAFIGYRWWSNNKRFEEQEADANRQ